MQTPRLLLLVAALLSLLACSKDKTESNEDLLTRAPWRITDWAYSSDSGKTFSPEPKEDCMLDDTLTLNKDLTFKITAGKKICDPTDPAVVTGTWSLVEKKLKLSAMGDIESYKLSEITRDKMILDFDEDTPDVWRTIFAH